MRTIKRKGKLLSRTIAVETGISQFYLQSDIIIVTFSCTLPNALELELKCIVFENKINYSGVYIWEVTVFPSSYLWP